MARIWTVVLSVWAMLAIVAFLAWSHAPVSVAQPAAQTLVVKSVNGKQQLVSVAAPHATTATSAVARP